jgi:hypothetical protein
MSQELKQALIESGKIVLAVAVQAAIVQLGIEVQKHMGLTKPQK